MAATDTGGVRVETRVGRGEVLLATTACVAPPAGPPFKGTNELDRCPISAAASLSGASTGI